MPSQNEFDALLKESKTLASLLNLARAELEEDKKQHIETLEYALKCMLINDFIEDCVPVVKIKSEIKKLKGELK